MDRLDQDRRGLTVIARLGRLQIAERHLIEAFHHRTKAFEIFFLSAGGERGQRAAMERALEGDDAVALRPSARRLVFARGLDRAFHRLGAGIAEEHHVRKACIAQPPGDALGFRDLIEIGDVPQLLRLLGQRGDKMRVRVPERVDGNA